MALKTFSWNKNLIVPALGPRQCCRGAAVPGHQQPTGWPVTQEAPSSLTGAANDQPPWFCHTCKHIFWSTGLLCTTPSPGQVTGYRCFTPGKGCPDAGNAGGLLQTHLPMPTHPEKPLVPATGTKNPLSLCHLRMPWARCSPGGHWLLSHTGQVWGNGLGPRQGPTLPGWGLKGFSQACPCFCMSFYKLLSIVPGLSKVLKSPQIPFFIVTHGNGGIHARQWRDLSFSFKVRHAKQSDVLTPHQESAPDLAFLCKLSSRLTANESLLLRGHINPLISLEQRGKIRISFREGNQNMMNSESSAALWEKNDSSCSQTEVCTCEGESGLVETNEEESSWMRPERVTQMGKTGSKKNFLHLVSVS